MATLPVKKVVVMEDRAQVERRGTVALSGVTKVEIEGLPMVAVDRSLKLEVKGGTLIDAKFERRWKEQPKGGLPADASALRTKVKNLENQKLAQADGVARLDARAEVYSTARADLLRAISEFSGFGTSEVAQWKTQLAALSEKQAALDEERRLARQALAFTEVRHQEARTALGAAEEPLRRMECVLALTLEGTGEAQVRASYLVPCAVWRPAYRATLTGEQVQVEAEGVVWQRTGEDWDQVELLFSTARPTLGTSPPSLVEDRLYLRAKQEIEKRVVDVSIREEVIQTAGETTGTPEMPGLDDGGETRLLQAAGATTIRSDGQPHRVALFAFEAKAVVERVCPAEISSLVFAMSRFTNSSGQVLLAGPVDLIRNSGLVGRAQLKFAAPGETVKLSFGNEDGLQVIRDTEEKIEEARLTGRRTTTKKVQLHVSNTRKEALRLIIEERVPVSEVKEVEIQVLTKDCAPAPAPLSKDGIARIEIELAANATKTAKFSWELSAAAKVAGV
jgi:uncharacterized protein (TIGR02231 family)